ncbi:MAG: RNA polymerase sigma factor [Microbacter sp.]
MTDFELIQEILAGNSGLFRQLMERYQTQVFRTCMGFVHQKEDADDLTQEVFIQAYQSLASFKGDSEFSTWLYRIAVNRSLNHLRDQQKRSIFDRLESFFTGEKSPKSWSTPTPDPNPEQQILINEEREMITNMLDKLPEKQRVAIVLSKYDDMSQREIAEVLQTTEGAVEALLQRAKKTLRKELLSFYRK